MSSPVSYERMEFRGWERPYHQMVSFKGLHLCSSAQICFQARYWRAKFLTWPWMFLSAQFLGVSIWRGIPTSRAELSRDSAVRGKHAVDQKERWHGWLSPTLLQRGRVRAGPLIKMSLLCRPVSHTLTKPLVSSGRAHSGKLPVWESSQE